MFRQVINLLFPPHRHVRAAERTTLEEFMKLYRLRVYKGVHTALPYDQPAVRAVIKANKYYGSIHASHLLAATLNQTLSDIAEDRALLPEWNTPLLLPIPSSPKRRRERGYNQIEHIIQKVPKETLSGFVYAPHLRYRDHRESQARIPKSKRSANMEHVFFVPEKNLSEVSGKYIVLIDDVAESGATMRDAMRALTEAGACVVTGIALAK